MMKFLLNTVLYVSVMAVFLIFISEARSENSDTLQSLNAMNTDVDEVRLQGYYDSIPLNKLQMLVGQYRAPVYLRQPSWELMNELLRLPKTKRESKYKQCLFNPISCFKK